MKYLFLLIVLSGISCSSGKIEPKTIFKTTFEKTTNKLPSNVILFDNYFDKNKSLFFLNRDYLRTYSQIVEYNTNKNAVVKEIFSINKTEGHINEYCFDGRYIAWVVSKRSDDIKSDVNSFNVKNKKMKKILSNILCGTKADVYSYNIETKKMKKILSNILYSKKGEGPLLLSLKINDENIAWIENDFESNISRLNVMNLIKLKISTVDSAKFLENEYFKHPMVFVEFKNGKLFYGKKTSKQTVSGHLKVYQ